MYLGDFDERIIAVIKQERDLPGIDFDDPQEELARQPQSKRGFRVQDVICGTIAGGE